MAFLFILKLNLVNQCKTCFFFRFPESTIGDSDSSYPSHIITDFKSTAATTTAAAAATPTTAAGWTDNTACIILSH